MGVLGASSHPRLALQMANCAGAGEASRCPGWPAHFSALYAHGEGRANISVSLIKNKTTKRENQRKKMGENQAKAMLTKSRLEETRL